MEELDVNLINYADFIDDADFETVWYLVAVLSPQRNHCAMSVDCRRYHFLSRHFFRNATYTLIEGVSRKQAIK